MSLSESASTDFNTLPTEWAHVQGVSEKSPVWNNANLGIGAEPLKENLDQFVGMINTEDKITQLEGLVSVRKLLSLKEKPPIQEVIDSGVVPKLLEFMKWDNEPRFQYESAWAITNICSGTSQDVEFVVNLGGLDIIIDLLNSDLAEVLDQAVWALGNVAGDNTAYRNLCLQKDSMKKLVNVFERFGDNQSIKRNSVWAISNLLRGKPIPQWDQISAGIPIIKQVIGESEFGEVLIDALWAVSWASELYIQEIIDIGCVPHLVHHLKSTQLSVLIPALRALGNVVTGDDSQTNIVLGCSDFLPRVFELISNNKKTIRKEACWLVSNIAAGNNFQISLVLEHPSYIEALKAVLSGDVPEVATEAAWALGNLASGACNTQISKMVNEYGYVDCLKIMLESTNTKVKQIGLEASLNVLNAGKTDTQPANIYLKEFQMTKMVEKIEAIGGSQSSVINNLVDDILAFFDGVEDISLAEGDETQKETGDNGEADGSEDEEDDDDENDEDESSNDGISERRRIENDQEVDEDDEKYRNMERED